jgi:hypothetical protein
VGLMQYYTEVLNWTKAETTLNFPNLEKHSLDLI